MLILGGTSEARALASMLVERGVPVVSSLAGRVSRPRLPAGEVRIGGFGGPEGLATWLRERGTGAVVDATHPYAQRISASAAKATAQAGVPLLRLQRPGWTPLPGADWRWAMNLEHAAHMLENVGDRVFLTTGRQGLAAFARLGRPWFLIRCVDPPDGPLPPRHEVVLARGPYTLHGELALMGEHGVDVLVTKDSGGTMTSAKLHAARELGLPIVVISRPPSVEADTTADVDGALHWLQDIGAVR